MDFTGKKVRIYNRLLDVLVPDLVYARNILCRVHVAGTHLSATHGQIAFFGCGDSQSYGDNWCDAMGELHEKFSATGASVIGIFHAHIHLLRTCIYVPNIYDVV